MKPREEAMVRYGEKYGGACRGAFCANKYLAGGGGVASLAAFSALNHSARTRILFSNCASCKEHDLQSTKRNPPV